MLEKWMFQNIELSKFTNSEIQKYKDSVIHKSPKALITANLLIRSYLDPRI